jgi:hypothetical protein
MKTEFKDQNLKDIRPIDIFWQSYLLIDCQAQQKNMDEKYTNRREQKPLSTCQPTQNQE